MNEYYKAGRYSIKRDSEEFFRWYLANPSIEFQAWIDARRVALPSQGDLSNDLVAALATFANLAGCRPAWETALRPWPSGF